MGLDQLQRVAAVLTAPDIETAPDLRSSLEHAFEAVAVSIQGGPGIEPVPVVLRAQPLVSLIAGDGRMVTEWRIETQDGRNS